MHYYKIIGYGSCPWCQRANSLLLQEKLAFIACWIENSLSLVEHYKTNYNMKTVPIVLKIDFETGDEHVIGGYTDLKEHIDKEIHQEGHKEAN
tara:strand:- start:402 stop:680 length:279 start_codon:yes stop_codon:yes gene_type:complete